MFAKETRILVVDDVVRGENIRIKNLAGEIPVAAIPFDSSSGKFHLMLALERIS